MDRNNVEIEISLFGMEEWNLVGIESEKEVQSFFKKIKLL